MIRVRLDGATVWQPKPGGGWQRVGVVTGGQVEVEPGRDDDPPNDGLITVVQVGTPVLPS